MFKLSSEFYTEPKWIPDKDYVSVPLLKINFFVVVLQSYLKHYFRSCSRQLSLFDDLKTHFPKLPYALDEQKVMVVSAIKRIKSNLQKSNEAVSFS